jgi:hypothetical protein
MNKSTGMNSVQNHLTVSQYLRSLSPAMPLSIEKHGYKETGRHALPSNGELKRWIESGSVIINGESSTPHELVDYPVFSLVFFPKSEKRRTTII